MGLRLAKEKDCNFFYFWYEQQVLQGVDCQGEMFVAIEQFSLSQQALAYELASQIEIMVSSALVIRSDKAYVVCANLTGTAWQTLLPSPEPSPESSPESNSTST
jgi:hypothetical protein